MKKSYTFTFFLFFLFLGKIQSQDIGSLVRIGAEDLNAFAKAYLEPVNPALGEGLSNGWHNTAQVLKPWRFEVRIIAGATLVPEAAQSFNINALNLQSGFKVADGQNPITPTLFGNSSDGPRLEQIFEPPLVAATETVSFNAPQGLGVPVAPVPMAQVSVGLPYGIETTLRFLPNLSFDFASQEGVGTTIGLFGFGVKWDFKRWIPRVNLWNVDMALALGYTTIVSTANLDINPDNIPQASGIPQDALFYEGQKLIFDNRSFNIGLLISKEFGQLFTLFGGLQFNNSRTILQLQGNYPYVVVDTNPSSITYSQLVTENLSNPLDIAFSFKQTSLSGGMRFRVGVLTLSFSGTYGSKDYHSANFSIGFGRYD